MIPRQDRYQLLRLHWCMLSALQITSLMDLLMAHSNLSPSLHQPLSYPPVPPPLPLLPPSSAPSIPVGLNKKWGSAQTDTFVTHCVLPATKQWPPLTLFQKLSTSMLEHSWSTHAQTHACICPRRDKGTVDHDRASLVTTCHLLFTIHAPAPDSRPCHRGD